MKSQYILPITIVVAGALIAGGVFWAGKSGTQNPNPNPNGPTDARPYTPGQDHIMGNPQAPIKIIEYADLECPYCKQFDITMHQIMDYYGSDGKVAWVFRHFPLTQIHSKAPKEAEATECAADQGGDAAFFKYIEKIYEITPGENNLDLAQLPVVAKNLGLNVDTFNSCLSSGKYSRRVQDNASEAVRAGAQGTPYTLIMVGENSIALSGAQPYNSMRAAIDAILAQLPGGVGTTTPQ